MVLVVVMCGLPAFERQFVLTAHRSGMTTGDYVFIAFSQLPPDNLQTLWSNNDATDEEARIAFSSVLQVRVDRIRYSFKLCKSYTIGINENCNGNRTF